MVFLSPFRRNAEIIISLPVMWRLPTDKANRDNLETPLLTIESGRSNPEPTDIWFISLLLSWSRRSKQGGGRLPQRGVASTNPPTVCSTCFLTGDNVRCGWGVSKSKLAKAKREDAEYIQTDACRLVERQLWAKFRQIGITARFLITNDECFKILFHF